MPRPVAVHLKGRQTLLDTCAVGAGDGLLPGVDRPFVYLGTTLEVGGLLQRFHKGHIHIIEGIVRTFLALLLRCHSTRPYHTSRRNRVPCLYGAAREVAVWFRATQRTPHTSVS